MFKSLRVPEKLFGFVMWIISFVFASFLIGLGGKIVADLPRMEEQIKLEDFAEQRGLNRSREELEALRKRSTEVEDRAAKAQLELVAARNAYNSARSALDNWLATRVVTSDATQDPEVLERTRKLDELKSSERTAQLNVERLNDERLQISQGLSAQTAIQSQIMEAARAPYERAQFLGELRVFGARLAITLPLLVVAGCLLARKRKSDYWPLIRGFVLFAGFTFFVELVPYLPSYGGYVRSVVGVIATAVAGHYVIQAMRKYLAKRQEAAQRTESERRQSLGYEDALKKIAANVCPACERAVAVPGEPPANFCMHCGLNLFSPCSGCGVRRNAFFHHCAACGAAGSAAQEPAPDAPAPQAQ